MKTDLNDSHQMDSNTLLRAGIDAARAGRREHAREMLMRVVEQDERNATAWLWLSGVVDSPGDRQVCLENVLDLDPDNAAARKGLVLLEREKLHRLLQEGIDAARAGRREHARDLLTRVVEQDEQNVTAWLWLSGVVDSPDDRRVCLENVLDLDPDNAAARKGLAALQRAQALTSTPDVEPPAQVERAPLLPPEFSIPATPDVFDDPYICPFCGTPTHPDDRQCAACGSKLWVNYRRSEKRSVALWIAIALQAYNTFQAAIPPLMLSLVLFGMSRGMAEWLAIYADLFGADPTVLMLTLRIAFLLTLLPFFFSAAVLVGLYVRWKPVFYLLLIDAALGMLTMLAVAIVLLSSPRLPATLGNLFVAAFGLLVAFGRLMLAFQIQDDFAFEKERMLLWLDPDVSSGPMFLARGHKYAQLKMWAMAAIHLRKGVAMSPNHFEGRVALALVYIKLERFDLAARALNEARALRPDDPRIDELQQIVDRSSAVDG